MKLIKESYKGAGLFETEAGNTFWIKPAQTKKFKEGGVITATIKKEAEVADKLAHLTVENNIIEINDSYLVFNEWTRIGDDKDYAKISVAIKAVKFFIVTLTNKDTKAKTERLIAYTNKSTVRYHKLQRSEALDFAWDEGVAREITADEAKKYLA